MQCILTLIAVTLLQLSLVSSQTFYCETSSDSKVESGKESSAICVIFHGYTKASNLFYFSSEVDEYTLVGLAGSDLSNQTEWSTESKIQIEVGGVQSANRTIIAEEYAVTQIGFVIIAEDGKIDKITWDDGCFVCSGSECVDGKNCGTLQTSTSASSFDIKVESQ